LVKQRRLTTSLVAIALLLVLSLQLPSQDRVKATELITDNFNDMNYDGWGTFGILYNRTDYRYYHAGVGNFTAADQTLRVNGSETTWDLQYMNLAYLNHSINYGTWSFDLFIVDTPGAECVVHLIADHYNPRTQVSTIPGPGMNYSYLFVMITHDIGGSYDRPTIDFWRLEASGRTTLGTYVVGPPSYSWTNCWTHFDVTRNSTGYFNVYLNGTLRMSRQDNITIPSGYFIFAGLTGQAIDNVAIYDYIVPPPPPPAPPEPPTPPPDFTLPLIAIGAIELIVIIVLVILYVRRRP
jgi:hypothetical protein